MRWPWWTRWFSFGVLLQAGRFEVGAHIGLTDYDNAYALHAVFGRRRWYHAFLTRQRAAQYVGK